MHVNRCELTGTLALTPLSSPRCRETGIEVDAVELGAAPFGMAVTASPSGVGSRIKTILPNGSAAKAGLLRVHDMVLSVGSDVVAQKSAGAVRADFKSEGVKIKTMKSPCKVSVCRPVYPFREATTLGLARVELHGPDFGFGAAADPVTPDLGLVVTEIPVDGALARSDADVRAGDRLLTLDGQNISEMPYREAVDAVKRAAVHQEGPDAETSFVFGRPEGPSAASRWAHATTVAFSEARLGLGFGDREIGAGCVVTKTTRAFSGDKEVHPLDVVLTVGDENLAGVDYDDAIEAIQQAIEDDAEEEDIFITFGRLSVIKHGGPSAAKSAAKPSVESKGGAGGASSRPAATVVPRMLKPVRKDGQPDLELEVFTFETVPFGIELDEHPLGSGLGAVVSDIEEDSPLRDSGVRLGDMVMVIDNECYTEKSKFDVLPALRDAVKGVRAGVPCTVVFGRASDGGDFGLRPGAMLADIKKAPFGMALKPMRVEGEGKEESRVGCVIAEVMEEGPADNTGRILPGDVLVSVDGEIVAHHEFADIKQAVKEASTRTRKDLCPTNVVIARLV